MSNGDTSIVIASEGEYHLRLALELALTYHTGPNSFGGPKKRGVDNWAVINGGIYFGWGGSTPGMNTLPVRTDIDELVPMILRWLAEQDYPSEPDIDGSTHKGWRFVSHFDKMPDHPARFYLNFGVHPHWCEYHK